MARALHDPLMSDPELARRSEANAVIALGDSAPLPMFTATPESSAKARETARTALLEGGAIPPLTALSAGAGGKALDKFDRPGAIRAAPLEDALGYHDVLAQRAGFSVKRYDQPEAIIAATGKQGENLRVHVRALPTGMNAVDLVFWINP